MTFFLNELIPKTDSNIGLHGTFRVDIYPGLDPKIGDIKNCLFF